MTLAENIIAFSGTGVGSLIIGWWINKKRDDIEVTIKEQVFYKTLIEDLESQRSKEKDAHKIERKELLKKLDNLKKDIDLLIIQNKEKDNSLLKWEIHCEKLQEIIKKRDAQIDRVLKGIKK